MTKAPLFSTYRQGENRVTSSLMAVLQRIDLDLVERILASSVGESSLEMVNFVNQVGSGGGTVPDAGISADFHYLLEVKTELEAVRADQLHGHLLHLRQGATSQRLFVITPDPSRPVAIDGMSDDRVVWFNFVTLDQAIAEVLNDQDDPLPEREAFLLRELRRLFVEDGLLNEPDDTVVVAARSAYPEYLELSAYICQPNRFRSKIARLGFYTNKQIRPEFPCVLHSEPVVEFTNAEASRLASASDPWGSEVARLIRARLASGKTAEGEVLQVMVLSAPDAEETIRLTRPIQHTGPNAWTMGHRWIRSSVLETDPETTDELRK